VILSGRTAVTEKSRAVLDSFAAGRVEYRPVDIVDARQASRLIADIVKSHGRLNGIIHCAGMVAPNVLVKKTAEEIRRVLAPKVTGAVNLDSASSAIDLDFLILFSSISAALGSPGAADYAAASAFMDRFASYRNEQVRAGERCGRTVSINWPLWRAGGMSAGEAGADWLQQMTGMQPLETGTAMIALSRALELPAAQALVMEGDAARIERFFATSLQGGAGATTVPQAVEPGKSVTRASADSRRATLAGLLKADLQAFQRGRH